MVPNTRLIALYLPQFHPIPENDQWWGQGFTEWRNTAKARPMFRDHYQPHVPADLGFYDLRVAETRIAQAAMAREYGIEAFCYYHYWFAGKRIIERPFSEVLASGTPDFPFALCWANQTWTGVWHGAPGRVLIEQTYPGDDDHRRHFEALLPAFLDKRYVTVDGKPLFMLFRPDELPDSNRVLDLWRSLAVKAGLRGIFFVGEHEGADWDPKARGYDAAVTNRMPSKRRQWVPWSRPIVKIRGKVNEWRGRPTIYDYDAILARSITPRVPGIESFPCVIPNWDNTPRSGINGIVFQGASPERFRVYLRRAIERMRDLPDDRRIVFIKSWNEWAEGNHLEPDLRFGRKYLEVVREEVMRHTASAS